MYGERDWNSCFLRKSLVNHLTYCREKIELVASRDQQSVFSRSKGCIELLYPRTIFLEDAFLIYKKALKVGLGKKYFPRTPLSTTVGTIRNAADVTHSK